MTAHRPCQLPFAVNLLIPLGLLVGMGATRETGRAGEIFALYKSTDGGASWHAVGEALPPRARINGMSAVGNLIVAGTDQGIFMSRDEGTHWQSPPPGLGRNARVFCVASFHGQILAGTHRNGVIASKDGGVSWEPMNQGLTDLNVRTLLTVGTRVYAGTDRSGIFVSGDGTLAWRPQASGLPALSQVFDLAFARESVFAGLYSHGLYRWDLERRIWLKAGDVVPLELAVVGQSLVAGHNPGGVFVSEDAGETWLDGNLGLPSQAPIWTLSANDELLFAGTTGSVGLTPENIGLFVSRDRGRSWSRSDSGLPPSSAAVAILVTKRFALACVVTSTSGATSR
jgi:hypothetical protein